MNSFTRTPIRGIIPSTYKCCLKGRQLHERPSGTRFINTKPLYDGHIPLNWFENAFLAVGSAVMSLVDPRRGGRFSVNVFGVVEAECSMK